MGKSKSKITNWKEYNKALVQRGSLTFWVDDSAVESWYCEGHHGGRGRSNLFSDTVMTQSKLDNLSC